MNVAAPVPPSSGRTFWTLIAVAVFAVLCVATYFSNPLGTADDTPRGRLLGFRVYRQPSVSMEPTMRFNDFFIVSAWPYARDTPRVGDIIVYRYHRDPSVSYAKRIIAAGGSTVAIVDGVTLVDGMPLPEPYLRGQRFDDEYSRSMPTTLVPADTYFVMGDNRGNSQDSRSYGAIPRSLIVGRVASQ